jgi:hypothetical protein
MSSKYPKLFWEKPDEKYLYFLFLYSRNGTLTNFKPKSQHKYLKLMILKDFLSSHQRTSPELKAVFNRNYLIARILIHNSQTGKSSQITLRAQSGVFQADST